MQIPLERGCGSAILVRFDMSTYQESRKGQIAESAPITVDQSDSVAEPSLVVAVFGHPQ